MIAEQFALAITTLLRHTLPERNGQTWVVTCHCSKDKTKVVGFSLVITRVLEVGKLEAHLSYQVGESCGCGTNALSLTYLRKHVTTDLCGILLAHLLRKLFG